MTEAVCAGEFSLQFCLEHLSTVLAFCWSSRASLARQSSGRRELLFSGPSNSVKKSARGARGNFLLGTGDRDKRRPGALCSSSSSSLTPTNLTGGGALFFLTGESVPMAGRRCSVSGSRYFKIDFLLWSSPP